MIEVIKQIDGIPTVHNLYNTFQHKHSANSRMVIDSFVLPAHNSDIYKIIDEVNAVGNLYNLSIVATRMTSMDWEDEDPVDDVYISIMEHKNVTTNS